jgi:SOCE-associated regulatory factor of calcium homoeostasis
MGRWYLSLSLSCWLSFAAAWQAQTGTANDKKVLLSSVQTITLQDGLKTSGRRNSPLPQLECRGSNCRKGWKPPSVQCFNRGTDGVDVQWECQAEMPAGFSFGQTEVRVFLDFFFFFPSSSKQLS